jgi:hypothetical protein
MSSVLSTRPFHVLSPNLRDEEVRTTHSIDLESHQGSCMSRPQDAKKAAWALQTFSTVFYVAFAVVMYVYIGDTVASPAYSSLPETWAKISWGLALPNLLSKSLIPALLD